MADLDRLTTVFVIAGITAPTVLLAVFGAAAMGMI